MATEAEAGAVAASKINPLAMDDASFMKAGIPADLDLSATAPEQKEGEDTTTASAEGADTVTGGADTSAGSDTLTGDDTNAGGGNDSIEGGAGADTVAGATGGNDTVAGGTGTDTGTKDAAGADKIAGAGEGDKTPNYEAFYKEIMKPFKANGKTIELRSPDEAVKLMQMGANYTRKMQELVPHRKVMTMLQNNNLLDEAKLSFLIDLDKKNPEAIKKLIKDSGIDPLEIDTTAEPAYLPGSHAVTDEEVNFRSALEELSSTPEGKETLQDINTRWDQSSKELLWKHPETFSLIDQQRQVGIYDRIAAEIDRRKVLGLISPQTPFLEAYKVVGDELTAANGFADLVDKHQGTARQATTTLPGQGGNGQVVEPVATRVMTPKPQVNADDRASAASPTRASAKPAKETVNPLQMSDDDFLKTFNGRL